MSVQKSKNWVFELYPDSMNSDYLKIIQEELCVPMAISPLHDKDVNADGSLKKPHYHCLVCYDGNTTYNNVKKNICDRLGGTIPLVCLSLRGTYRYHLHLDNPEKYQYDDRDRVLLCGFDVSKVEALTYTEILKYLKQIQRFIIDNNILEYSDLLDILLENDEYNMWDVAVNHTLVINSYIKSKRHKQLPIIDKNETKKEND